MDPSSFESRCKSEGFTDLEQRTGTPNFTSQPHTHPFDVRALVLTGEFTLNRNGVAEKYVAGESFSMEAGCVHAESFGPQGSVYLLGRKHHAAST